MALNGYLYTTDNCWMSELTSTFIFIRVAVKRSCWCDSFCCLRHSISALQWNAFSFLQESCMIFFHRCESHTICFHPHWSHMNLTPCSWDSHHLHPCTAVLQVRPLAHLFSDIQSSHVWYLQRSSCWGSSINFLFCGFQIFFCI